MISFTDTAPAIDRRETADRRRRPTSPIRPLFGPRRRYRFRRAGEEKNSYVDRLHPKVVAWSFIVMSLCALDAVLTLIHIEVGGEELWPTMRWALSISQETFLGIKLSVTAIGAVFLAVHQNFFVGKFCIRFVFFTYFFLTIYHMYVAYMRG